MTSLNNKNWHQNIFRALFILAVLALLFSLPDRKIQSDENWFGEQAYWLENEGEVKLKSIPDIFDWQNKMLVHHKLLTWSGAGVLMISGWSLTPLRLFMILLVSLTVFTMWRLAKIDPDTLNREHTILAIFILLITPEFIQRVNLFRPEILVMFFGMLTYYFLHNAFTNRKNIHFLATGLFSGLCFLSHLNAFIFPVACFITIALWRNWKGLILFSITCFLTGIIYTEGLWAGDNLSQFFYELQNWPSHSFKSKVEGGGVFMTIWNNIAGILDEHKRYFWSQEVWIVSGSFALSLLFFGKTIRQKNKVLVDFTLLLMLLLGLISSGNAPRYMMYLMPFMALIVSYAILEIEQRKILAPKIIALVVLLAQLTFLSISYIDIFKHKEDHLALNNKVLSHIPKYSSVIGYWDLIYNYIDEYDLRNFKTYEYLEEKRPEKFEQLEILNDLYDKQVEYIILDCQMKDDKVLHWFKGWELSTNKWYKEIVRDEDFLILMRIQKTL